jgi:putative PIG3 family NAD(P)H quinone oxidoreductase
MKAVYITEFGPSGNLEIREIADPPRPKDSQILVRVKAAGLNRADLLQRRGSYPPPPGFSPNIPGLEFAGEVVGTGQETTLFSIGDRVVGITAGEAQAELILTEESLLAAIPANLSFTKAAAVPEAFITAHDAIFTQCCLQEHEWLLVHAVGSGVGLAALQLAKAAGVYVIGTSRTQDKLDRCSDFGLDISLLTEEPRFADAVLRATDDAGTNVVLDLVGAAYFSENIASLAKRGRMILVGLTSGATAEFELGLALHKRLKIIGTVLRARTNAEKAETMQRFIDEVMPLLASGAVRPNLDRAFDAENVSAAYNYLESNASFGKVVLKF